MFIQRTSLILLFSTALNGCDSSYHAFDGNSGYRSNMITPDNFSLQYTGNQFDTKQDVETMWHHRARELCRGAAYQADHLTVTKVKNPGSLQSGETLPQAISHYYLSGEVLCLAPNLARKRKETNTNDESVADIK
ncbi:hypothetical protein [Neptuniibacter sp.]|uniref:hypothetical protein n=1 Tax=Neptuniibacter sp. TaxID=1962643 RepID=UPI002637F1BE|nr:hypothetical protein [Neptuniibacter sp.]MCP4596936.1 hypothetical protein [Neptuniibacter sp.]